MPASGSFLGIETSGTDTGVAVCRGSTVLFERSVAAGTRHDELLLPLIEEGLRGSGIHLQSLAGIGVTIGPGMFTSLRVGLSTAKGLALAHGLPVTGVNTLQALAASVCPSGSPVLAAIDARKSQVYAAVYQWDEPMMPPAVFTPAELALRLTRTNTGPVTVVGDGLDVCQQELRNAGLRFLETKHVHPLPRVVALLAADAMLRLGRPDPIEALEPLYLRRTDAELTREKRKTGSGR